MALSTWFGTGMAPSARCRPGPVPSRCRDPRSGITGLPRARDHIRFTPAILPRWVRRTPSLDALLPTLYLRGVSTDDLQETLSVLLGKDAPTLSPSVIGRLTAA